MKRRTIIDSFNYAVSGIITSLKTEKNMKVHYIIAILTIILSLFFDFTRTEFLLLLFAISLVVVILISCGNTKTIWWEKPNVNSNVLPVFEAR